MQQVWNLLRSFEDEFKSDEEEIKQRGRDVRIAVEFAKMKSDEEEKALNRTDQGKQSKFRRLMKRSVKITENSMESIKYYQTIRDIERSSELLIPALTCASLTCFRKEEAYTYRGSDFLRSHYCLQRRLQETAQWHGRVGV